MNTSEIIQFYSVVSVCNFELSFVASRLFEFAKMASEFVDTLTEQLKCRLCEIFSYGICAFVVVGHRSAGL